jgi:hypothetical protein
VRLGADHGRRKDRVVLPHMEPRPVLVKRVTAPSLEQARSRQVQRFGKLEALHEQGAGNISGRPLQVGGVPAAENRNTAQQQLVLDDDDGSIRSGMKRSTILGAGRINPRTGMCGRPPVYLSAPSVVHTTNNDDFRLELESLRLFAKCAHRIYTRPAVVYPWLRL